MRAAGLQQPFVALASGGSALAREQAHGAIGLHRGRRRNDTLLVHRESQQRGVALGRDHLAQIGDIAAIGDFHHQSAQRGIALRLLQVHLVAGRHRDDLAFRRAQGAAIDHRGRRHDDAARFGGIDLRPLLELDRGLDLLALAIQHEFALFIQAIHLTRAFQGGAPVLVEHLGEPLLEGVIGDVESAGHQAVDVDPGVLAEDETVRIEEENLSVGLQLAHDGAGIGLEDTVERHGRGAGLPELDRVLDADIEFLPVQDGLPGILVDGHLVTGDHLVGTPEADQGGLGNGQFARSNLAHAQAQTRREDAANGHGHRPEANHRRGDIQILDVMHDIPALVGLISRIHKPP